MSENNKETLEYIRRESLDQFMKMVPDAVKRLGQLLSDPDVLPGVQAELIDMILNRALGKPEETVNLISRESSMEEAFARVDQMLARIRGGKT